MDFKQKIAIAQIKNHKQSLIDNKRNISLNKILGSKRFQSIIINCRPYREVVYTPIKTLFIFIKQVLNPDKSCKNAVAEVVAEYASSNKKSVSLNTGPYCKARQRLPEATVYQLVKESGRLSTKNVQTGWKILGRELKVVDGTSVIMPDTAANQRTFPQQNAQKEGIGFPIARIVVIMSLTTGTILDYAIGAFKGKGTGEFALFRRIVNSIKCNDILLGDRYYPSFFVMADLLKRGADGIFRGHVQRHYDLSQGKILGSKDHIVTWEKPSKPEWMDERVYKTYPDGIQVREFKMNGNIFVTTFLDCKKYHKEELEKIYQLRWQVEIGLKNIKEVMGMDLLSCKTADMVIKEVGIHFLAYNFIRIIMLEACVLSEMHPLHVSFKSTVQLLNKFMPYFISSNKNKAIMYGELLRKIVKSKIGNRPGRLEPRKLKRRQQSYKLLMAPREIEKKRLMIQLKNRIIANALA